MSRYAASARIATARPHMRALDAGASATSAMVMPPAPSDVSEITPSPACSGPVIDLLDDDPSTWLERAAIGWGQLTWYLFNPEGWR